MDRPRRLMPSPWPALAAAVALAMAATHPAAADPAATAGAWDLVLDGSPRQCRVMLGLEPAGSGHALRFPLGCRRALPILTTAASWSRDEDTIRVSHAGGQPVLIFRPGGEAGVFVAEADGQTYRLVRQERATAAAAPPPPLPPPIALPRAGVAAAASAPAPETLPGLYAVDRAAERDVCRLGLRSTASGPGRFELQVIGGCADHGLAVFDPVAWRYDAGRLILTARRGFEAILISEHPEQWRRQPEAGAPLILRKMPPEL